MRFKSSPICFLKKKTTSFLLLGGWRFETTSNEIAGLFFIFTALQPDGWSLFLFSFALDRGFDASSSDGSDDVQIITYEKKRRKTFLCIF